MLSLEKSKKYYDIITTTLVNKNIDTDDDTWKHHPALQALLLSNQAIHIITSEEIGLNSSELLIVARVTKNDFKEDSIIDKITSTILKTETSDKNVFKIINILWIIPDIECRLKLQSALSFKNINRLITQIKKEKTINVLDIFPIFYIDKDISKEEIKLPNVKRYEMLTEPPINSRVHVQNKTNSPQNPHPCLKGFVFTVNLFELVKIYNKIGDDLFLRNVRLGIKEQFGVDNAIKDTLKNEPQYFWFRNNGITILTENPEFPFDRSNELVLKREDKESLDFSVINGAQTITAAAEYYFNPQHQNDSSFEEQMEKSKQAQVIVRIIQIKDKKAADEAKKISIALNRQKPIKAEDMAFTNAFVEKFNTYLAVHQENYILSKRSESSHSFNAYSLIQFARARKACAGSPSDARGKSTAVLLKEDENLYFEDDSIFIRDWYDADEEKQEEIFNQYYRPILFAIQLANLYESHYMQVSVQSENMKNVIQNGKWHFVAFIVYMLNNGDENYKMFNSSIDTLSEDNLKVLMSHFAEFYCSQQKNSEINANAFKSSRSYQVLKSCDYKKSALYSTLAKFFHLPSLNDSECVDNTTHVTSVELKIENSVTSVSNATDAFVHTIEHCLQYAHQNNMDMKYIINQCKSFITSEEKNNSYFKSKSAIHIDGQVFYIGKKSSFVTKTDQVGRLCKLLQLKSQTIIWKDGAKIVYQNS